MGRVTQHENGCWLYTGHTNGHGYGIVRLPDRSRMYAHRLSYVLHVGPIPTHVRHEIHHRCGVPRCVNPDHLECLTRSEHARLNEQYARATCVRGHPRTSENIRITKDGHRLCKVCDREKHRERRRARGLKQSGWHNKDKTHCKHGHPFDEENTIRLPNGGRACLACRRETQRRYRARKRV